MLRRFSVATAKAVVTQAAANDVQGAMRIAAQIPDFSPATCAQILSHPDCWSQLAPATEIAAKRELLDILVDNGQMPNAACMSPLLSALTKAQVSPYICAHLSIPLHLLSIPLHLLSISFRHILITFRHLFITLHICSLFHWIE